MVQPQNINIQEETDLKKIADLILRNYKLFILAVILALGMAYLVNRFSVHMFKISSSVLIKEGTRQSGGGEMNNYINSSLFGKTQNLQNELWIMKSSPVIDQTVRNLDLSVTYYRKEGLRYLDDYQNLPFKISWMPDHPQPLNIRIYITILNDGYFQLRAESKRASFYNFKNEQVSHIRDNWVFIYNGKFGELIETPDLALIVEKDTTKKVFNKEASYYGFDFKTIASISSAIKDRLAFNVVDKLATVIEISFKTESVKKGTDIVNELMNVYSEQNLERKNHIASITIDYIERQLDEISDSLIRTEDNLQSFRSSNQLLNIADQSTGLSKQYMDLQNQLAELVTRKRYYDYVSDYLIKNDNFSNMMLPAAIGIQDQLLNKLMSELITSQAQRSNLIENNQERNPLVQKLGIQIENLKKTISENIGAVSKTTSMSVDEMNKRITKTEGEISRLPVTQRRLGNIERTYRLNDAIYNYLLEKRAEAKITKASNLPDDIIIEPARAAGLKPVSPKKTMNYLIALFLGLTLPFSFISLRSALNNKIESQDELERITEVPVLGKIFHNKFKTNNVMFEFPKSNIAESFRSLRTNLDFYVRSGQKKVIMVTSSMEGEGKTFVALNIAMSYAQLDRKTILLDFDLRKSETYFNEKEETKEGLSFYLINKVNLGDIINKSPHENLDYILSGVLPPNPTELVALGKTEELITQLKNKYDYIILDTTPLGQVTDAYQLINLADVKVIIARYNHTFKKVFSLVMKDLKHKGITNACIVLNDNRFSRDQYGFGYGYNKKSKKGINIARKP
jgi:tyrosine-protein kinase Etk/Wzc